MKFGRIVLQVNTYRLMESDFCIKSYFQDGGHDVIWHNNCCHLLSEREAVKQQRPSVPDL